MSGTTERNRPFYHQHPYEIFIPSQCRSLIVGTLPPPRFSSGELKERDVDFCYGSCDSMLWPVLDALFSLGLQYDNSITAVEQRKEFLRRERIGICDIVSACYRRKIDASDLGMERLELRDIFAQLKLHPTIQRLVFTGGNTKNGPEYLFRRQARSQGIQLECVENEPPKKHRFVFDGRDVVSYSLTSPSNAANRAIGATILYKERRLENTAYTTFSYRLEQYGRVFRSAGKRSNAK